MPNKSLGNYSVIIKRTDLPSSSSCVCVGGEEVEPRTSKFWVFVFCFIFFVIMGWETVGPYLTMFRAYLWWCSGNHM